MEELDHHFDYQLLIVGVNPLTSIDVFSRQNGHQKLFDKMVLKVL